MINEQSIIKSKSERQELGVHRFINTGANGTLLYVPRFGKSRTGLKCASAYFKTSALQNLLIVALNDIQVNQWAATINTYNAVCNFEDKIYDIKITTISKFAKNHMNATLEYGMIIYDEIHKYTTDDRLKALCSVTITSKSKLGLTGTSPVGDKGKMILSVIPVIDVINEDEAISKGWISNYVEYNFGINFNDIEEKSYLMYSELITEVSRNFRGLGAKVARTIFTKDFNEIPTSFNIQLEDYRLIIAAAKGYYNPIIKHFINSDTVCKLIGYVQGYNKNLEPTNKYNQMIINNWSPTAISTNTNKFKVYVENRNKLMTDSINKMYATLDVVSKYKDKTIIIFMGSTKSADTITDMINSKFGNGYAACYHSKVESRFLIGTDGKFITFGNGKPKKFGKTGLKKYAIKGLKEGTIKVLVTVNSLDEGLDIPNINLAITTFGSTNPIQHTQRTARAKTMDFENINDKVTIINIFFDDFIVNENTINSRDKAKLLKRQSTGNSRIIKINTTDNLIMT